MAEEPLSTDVAVGAVLPVRRGRPRDDSRDVLILEVTLAVLAEAGYAGLTVDKVAARVGAGRATIYRRWPTKADLVLEAVRRLAQGDVSLDDLPDTGSLREDLVAMVLPQSEQEQAYRTRVLAAVASLAFTEEPRLAEAATGAGLGPWVETIELLVRRAVDRGEYPPPLDVAALARMVPMMCLARAVTQEPISRDFSLGLIDGILVPALRGGR